MAIDRTPVLKRCRQLGIDPAELGYSSKKESIRQPKRRRKESEYGMQLREKQKVKFIYGVLEKQFHGYFNKARKMNGVTGENLMIILESRLDNVVFRLGFARTRKEARQSVRHGHFTVNGKRVETPPKEMELLYHLASSPNRVYTRNQLLDEVWGFDYFGDSRTVDVHIKRLREKLDGVSDQWSLKTVWGVGYKFEVVQQ